MQIIADTSGLVRKTDCNVTITKIECKILSITGLATTSALNVFENETLNVSDLVKKKDYKAKIFCCF